MGLLLGYRHPDKNNDPSAASKFVEITQAYEVSNSLCSFCLPLYKKSVFNRFILTSLFYLSCCQIQNEGLSTTLKESPKMYRNPEIDQITVTLDVSRNSTPFLVLVDLNSSSVSIKVELITNRRSRPSELNHYDFKFVFFDEE